MQLYLTVPELEKPRSRSHWVMTREVKPPSSPLKQTLSATPLNIILGSFCAGGPLGRPQGPGCERCMSTYQREISGWSALSVRLLDDPHGGRRPIVLVMFSDRTVQYHSNTVIALTLPTLDVERELTRLSTMAHLC